MRAEVERPREIISHIRTSTEREVVLRALKVIAERVVWLETKRSRTDAAAIDRLSERMECGSWLLRLTRGDQVKPDQVYVNRLLRELKELNADEAEYSREQNNALDVVYRLVG